MIGNWRWNYWMGLAGFGITLLFTIGRNPFGVVLVRGFLDFAIWFLLGFAIRFAFGWLQPDEGTAKSSAAAAEPSPTAAGKEPQSPSDSGRNYQAVTPDDSEQLKDELLQQLGEDKEPGFTPLDPPRLARTDREISPQEMANALRYLSEE